MWWSYEGGLFLMSEVPLYRVLVISALPRLLQKVGVTRQFPSAPEALGRSSLLQGYLAHKKQRSPGTLQ